MIIQRSKYWHKSENQRNFLEDLAQLYGIKKPQDWGTITTRQIIKVHHLASSIIFSKEVANY